MSRWLSLTEVAERMGVSDQTVRRWVKAGKLDAYKPGKEYRVSEAALEQFSKESQVPKAQARPSEAGTRVALDADGRTQDNLNVAYGAIKRQLVQNQQALNRAWASGGAQAYTMVHENEALRSLAQRPAGELAESLLDAMHYCVQLENQLAAQRESVTDRG